MLNICAKCGVCDDINMMYYITDDDNDTLLICDTCAENYPDAISTTELITAIGGRYGKYKNSQNQTSS